MDKYGLSNENQAPEDDSSALFHRLLCDSGSSWGVKRDPSVSARIHCHLTQCSYSLTKARISAIDSNEKFYFQPSLVYSQMKSDHINLTLAVFWDECKWPQVFIRIFMCRITVVVKMVISQLNWASVQLQTKQTVQDVYCFMKSTQVV